MLRRGSWLVVAWCWGLAACSTFDPLDMGTLRCVSAVDCPGGAMDCVQGYCRNADLTLLEVEVTELVPDMSEGLCAGILCPEGFVCCRDVCVRLDDSCERLGDEVDEEGRLICDATLHRHCGGCNIACGIGEACVNGACKCGGVSDACGAGLICCGTACVDPTRSNGHCGGCNRACWGQEYCSNGKCVCEFGLGGEKICLPGETCCPGGLSCRNTSTDPESCGGCGLRCRPGERCVNGACVCAGSGATAVLCRDGESCCGIGAARGCVPDGDPLCQCGERQCEGGEACCEDAAGVNGLLCAALASDVRHCGACGVACPSGYLCEGGQCTISCQVGLTPCAVSSSDPQVQACVDLERDVENCGGCGINANGGLQGAYRCGAGEICNQGECGLTCQVGLENCGGVCVDVERDRAHCGACNNGCGAGEVCANGVCSLDCQEGFLRCGPAESPYCTDPVRDRENCHTCGNVCPARTVCVNRACVCIEGLQQCPGVGCTDVFTDKANCGSCGQACTAGEVCINGQCAVTCQAPLVNCGGYCKDTAVDPNHCGACGTTCASNTPANATVKACVGGNCVYECIANRGNCDNNWGNGCEVNLASTAAHCGGCGLNCTAGSYASATCSAGVCNRVCSAGRGNCNGSWTDGCEVNLNTSNSHCGQCGKLCPTGTTCQSGVCLCANGQPLNTNNNCGSCGIACTGGRVCVNGTCACPPGTALCGGTCTDLTTQLNCGGCDNVCASGAICNNGLCLCPGAPPVMSCLQPFGFCNGSACSYF